jgi:ABC-type uncharacterized transport system auxiliary subunit
VVPEDRFYRLSLDAPAARASDAVLPGTLGVARFRADGLTKSRAIVYSDAAQPLVARQYHYHHWIEVPPRLLQEEMVSYLRGAGVARQVVAAGAGPAPDYLVEGTIRRFEHVRTEGGSAVAVDIELQLRQRSTGEVTLVKEYARSVPADGHGMYEAARAFSRAVSGVYGEFLRDLR